MIIPLETYLRIGFPKLTQSEGANAYALEYSGPTAELTAPLVGTTWGDFPGFVTTSNIEPIQLSGYSILSVTVSDKFNAITLGTLVEVAYEVESVAISRPLMEHPDFITGGAYELTATDRVLLELFKNEPSTADKILFKVYQRDLNGQPTGASVTLSDNAQRYAKYLMLGTETFTDNAPICRKTSTYIGGPPPGCEVGSKADMFSGFPNVPTGSWEWLKTADRSIRAAGQRKWERVEELTGCKKVLIDNIDTYID